ncbi:VapE domain-containing protein [Mucilaginibacter sp.]
MAKNNEVVDASPSIVKVIQYFTEHYEFRKNIVTSDIECRRVGETDFREVNENTLYIHLRKDAGIRATISDVLVFLGSDYIREYDPFECYFEGIKGLYDPGQHGDYIERFAGYITAHHQPRFNAQLKKWLVRTVVCALVPDYFNKQAFILVSDQQNSGKTTFSRFLVPSQLQKYFVENISVDKDSLIALCANFIGMLDELSTLSRFEIGALKSIMSKLLVNVRHPYERRAKMTPRRISFFGSTNMTEFLTDDANVRWLCFEISRINWAYNTEIDINVVWSHAWHLWQQGFKYELTKEEIEQNEQVNEQFRIVSPEMELIQKYYAPGTSDSHDAKYTATDFLNHLSDKVNGRIRLNKQGLGKALKKLGFVPHSVRGYGSYSYPVKFYYIRFNDLTTGLP